MVGEGGIFYCALDVACNVHNLVTPAEPLAMKGCLIGLPNKVA